MSEWIRITIAVRKPTADRVIRIKNDYGLSYEELLNEYIRLKALLQRKKDGDMLYELNKTTKGLYARR